MHNGLSICQHKYSIRPCFCIAMPSLLSIQSSSRGLNNIITSEVVTKLVSTSELQLNLQKHIKICCCNFNKISIMKKKTLLQKNFGLTVIFDLTINFDFFDLITLEWLMVSA